MPHRKHEPDPPSRALNRRGRGHSPAATDAAGWWASAGQLVHVARRYGAQTEATRALRAPVLAALVRMAKDHAPLEFEVTPRSIVLDDEAVFVADHANSSAGETALQHELPWVLHRDGVRALRFERGLTEREAAALLDAVLRAAPASATHEDVVTLLWEAATEHVTLRTEESGLVHVNPLAQQAQSGPVPHVDDWPLPESGLADVKRLWTGFAAEEAAAHLAFHAVWADERAVTFPDAVVGFVTRRLTADPRPEMADALAASVVTWIATCVQRSDWAEATRAHTLLRFMDASGDRTAETLAQAFSSVDVVAITERLDECNVREQSRLFAFVVRVGAPALPLLMAALGRSSKARVRAGVTTALAYAFADDPAPLGRWLEDPRWHIVRNIVFVLGQIGGAQVVPHLAVAARHSDLRVRRAAIHALGQVPPAERGDVLLAQLDHPDGRLVAAALAILSREPEPEVTRALLARVRAADFENRPEEQKIALLAALADVGDDPVVAVLGEVLVRGGWFARRTPERTAAARALARIPSDAARTVLEEGLKHRSDAVREACDDALAQRGRS